MFPRVAHILFGKPVPTPDQVRVRLCRGYAPANRAPVGVLLWCLSPPFQSAHDHNAPAAVGSARDEFMVNVPIFRGFGQFARYILSLREYTLGACLYQWKCEG